MSLGDNYRNHCLDAIYGAGFTPPPTVYCALFTVMPTSSGGGTEVSGGGYARASTPNDVTHFPDASGFVKLNGVAVTFNPVTAPWGDIVGWAWMDALTAGNIIDFGQLGLTFAVTNKALTSNVATLTVPGHDFNAGDLVVIAGVDSTFDGHHVVTAVTSTTISYALTHADVASAVATGTAQGPIASPTVGQTPQFPVGALATSAQ